MTPGLSVWGVFEHAVEGVLRPMCFLWCGNFSSDRAKTQVLLSTLCIQGYGSSKVSHFEEVACG